MILGIDEVGRGPWAGPLVVGAVVLPNNFNINGLTDSKKLSAKKRVELNGIIKKQALGFGLGWVHVNELDEIGLSAALKLATIRAVEEVKVPYYEIIIDGTINFLQNTTKGNYVTTMPKADLLVPAVSAASIIAKVARDEFMENQNVIYPNYGFGSHVGYGTAKHQAALLQYGVTELHRKSFTPIKKLLNGDIMNNRQTVLKSETNPNTGAKLESGVKTEKVTAKDIGNNAELSAANWLTNKGFEIIEQNWKTKYCEIDIIASKTNTIYFVEVKYRSSNKHGGAIAAITPKKLQQMGFAANLYAANHNLKTKQQLAVVTVNQGGEIKFLKL